MIKKIRRIIKNNRIIKYRIINNRRLIELLEIIK